MDELETAVNNYLETHIGEGNVVTVKEVRNEVVPGFVLDGKPVSDVLARIRRFILQLADVMILQRVRPGVYLYWPNGRSQVEITDLIRLVDNRRMFDFSPVPRESGISLLTPPYVPLAFDSVASLSLSADFLIQRGLTEVDLGALQELSF